MTLAQHDGVCRRHALERVERRSQAVPPERGERRRRTGRRPATQQRPHEGRVGDEEKRDEAEQHPAPATRAARDGAHLGQNTTNTPAVSIATTSPSTRSFQTTLHGRASQIQVGTTAAQ
jgi:hypothetical protein